MHRHVASRVTGRVESGDAGHHFRSGLDLAQAGAGQFQIRLGNHRLLLGGHFAGQFGIAPEGELSLARDEFGRREQQRRVLAIADAPQVVEMEVSEQDHVDIARRVARGGEVAKQPAGRILEFVDAAACVDQHQLVASVDEGGVDLHHFRPRRVERGCEQASCVLGPIAPRRFRLERERAVADDGDLDGAELEAVEARLRPLARFGRMGRLACQSLQRALVFAGKRYVISPVFLSLRFSAQFRRDDPLSRLSGIHRRCDDPDGVDRCAFDFT